ncbi:MAG: FAD-dependent oxidoreductase [Burkholderiales bacterium]
MNATRYDVAVIGAGFAGLACARAAARRGLRVLVTDRKGEPGVRMHTTGLVVKEAAERWEIPAALTQRVHGVRLYSPSLRTLDLESAGYYFLATDTPALMRWLAREAARSGAHVRYGRPFGCAHGRADAERVARYVVGADGPRSRVARAYGLGLNREFLVGLEAEFEGARGFDQDRLHCFLDGELARGYIGWIVPGYNGVAQIGLACRAPRKPDLPAFLRKIAKVADLSRATCVAHRAGLIPVGGPVAPMASDRAMLIGDAAGLVSPLSAGGIHTALESGWVAAHAIADHLFEGGEAPALALTRQAPRFAAKRAMRALFDRGVPDAAFDALFATRAFTALARSVYFHHRGLATAAGWRDLAHTLLRRPA